MGKRIITQRRGKGSSTYRAHSHRKKYRLNYPSLEEQELKGKISTITRDTGREAPLAILKTEQGKSFCVLAPEGIREGETFSYGSPEEKTLSICELGQLPEGTIICNIEKAPGSGGSFCRSPGSFARILTKKDDVTIQFTSKKQKKLHLKCRATVGVIAGGGKLEKPLVKAGKRHHIMKSRGKLYPRTSGVAMNAVDHPFGSGRGRHIGKSKISPRHAPPGRNVGLIRPRRTGKKK